MITFLTTLIGWIITNRTQHSILVQQIKSQHELTYLKEKLSYAREQNRNKTLDVRVFLEELEDWFEKGRRMYLDALITSPIEIPDIDDLIEDEKLRTEELQKYPHFKACIEKIRQLFTKALKFRSDASRLEYIAQIYDPDWSTMPLWTWGSTEMPVYLPQIILAYEDEVLDQIYELIYGSEEGRIFPKIEDQFYGLHEAGIKAILRVRSTMSSHNISFTNTVD